jgi:predicted amidohydrolase
MLPETFTSGFSNDAIDNAETMDGPTVAWIREQARNSMPRSPAACSCATDRVCSTACCSPRPTAACSTYDKRHLFRYAKRARALRRGRER